MCSLTFYAWHHLKLVDAFMGIWKEKFKNSCPIQKEGLPGLRFHLEPACEQVSLWPGGVFGFSQPRGLLGSWGMNSGQGSCRLCPGCAGALGSCQQLSLAATALPTHSEDEFSWRQHQLGWNQTQNELLRCALGSQLLQSQGMGCWSWNWAGVWEIHGLQGSLGNLLCVSSEMFLVNTWTIMRCLVAGAKQGIQVGFRQKGAKEGNFENFSCYYFCPVF